MPRGVPASGKRRPRGAAASWAQAVEAASQDLADRVDEPAIDEEQASGADSVTEIEMPEVVAAPVSTPAPVPDAELSAEQLEIKRLRDELARAHGRKDPELEYEPETTPGELPDGEVIRIHVLEDGLTAQGKIWYRGEELEFRVGSAAHKETFDRTGRSWLDLRHDEFAQAERFGGRIMFRNGPWPGKTYLDGSFETLRVEKGDGFVAAPGEDELAAAEKARKRRAAPRLPTVV